MSSASATKQPHSTIPSVKQTPAEIAAAKGVDLNHELQDGFTARLIRLKARQLVGKAKLNLSDRQEIEQSLRILVVRRVRNFDPQVAHWNAFVTTIVERRVATILEARRSQKCEHQQNVISLSSAVLDEDGQSVELSRMIDGEMRDAVTGGVTRNDQDDWEVAEQVAHVLAKLPNHLRDLCERLKVDSEKFPKT